MQRLLFIVFFFLFNLTLQAQCVMCKGVTEGAFNNADDTVFGLNNGIVYLFLAPYVILGVIAFFWFKQYKKKSKMDEA